MAEAQPATRTIHCFSADSFFECPECCRRLDFADQVDEDEDGPIYEGECEFHGTFLVQAVEDSDEDDE